MTLIASISGIRGTIGGELGNNLTPIDIVRYTSAFGTWMSTKSAKTKVVIGRDARVSGNFIEPIVAGTLASQGFEVINLGLSTTPTVEMAVTEFNAAGGIVITASHNPEQWNALKLLNQRGEFVSKKGGNEILELLKNDSFRYAPFDHLGKIIETHDFIDVHISKILQLPLVDAFSVERSGFKVLVDGVNSSGGVYVPRLLKALGIQDIVQMNCVPDGIFAHNPEPLQEHLAETCAMVKRERCHLGIVVDPDVDRLVFVDEKGQLFGEEYTLVTIADYVLQHKPSTVISNLSSSRALRDLAAKYGCRYVASAVGEVNVVEMMKRFDASIGGEGNGGVIYPELHYGRDALVGIALFLTYLSKRKLNVSELRATYPNYFMSKQKADLQPGTDTSVILDVLHRKYQHEICDTTDGLKIDFSDSWVHLRRSNTEPIIRIYSEAPTQQHADELASAFREELLSIN